MAAAEAGEQRRIITNAILGSRGHGQWAATGRFADRGGEQRCRCGGGGGDRHAVQKVAARDGAVHAEELV